MDDYIERALVGKMLVSTPHVGDARFEKSVIFVCAHDDHGTMGLTLNKPLTDLDLSDLLSQLKIETTPETQIKLPVYIGGPLEPERGFLLHSSLHNQIDSTLVGTEFGISGTLESLKSFTKQDQLPQDIMFALGYAGWGEGQLEQEIKDNAWLTVNVDPDFVFGTQRDQLWEASMDSLGVTPSLLVGQIGHA